ncbi:hypothetical protein AB9K34_21390 [Sedimentitalea sp. XS_ASV28]|uniref:hypothetical protein n=1 Tax=Sedimentitalea sp. XS_ASV28 TaxID=3241296 RepID=UPI00351932C2
MSVSRWIIAVVFGLMLPLALNAKEDIDQKEIQPKTSEAKTSDEPPGDPMPVFPPIASPTNPPTDEHDQDAAHQSNKQPYQVPEIILGDGWAQWAMAFLALVGVGISGWAVWLLKCTLDATQGAIREAEKATIAAQEATVVARDVGEAQVRAYVTASKFKWVIPPGQESFVRAECQIENLGETPAFDCHTEFQVVVLMTPGAKISLSDALRRLPPVKAQNGASNGPSIKGMPAKMITDAAAVDYLPELARSGSAFIFLRGWITYTDVFNKARRTDFCMHIDSNSMKKDMPFVSSSGSNCMT